MSDHDGAVLREVGAAGLFPGTPFRLDAASDDGAVTVSLLSGDRAGETVSLGPEAPPFLFLDDVE